MFPEHFKALGDCGEGVFFSFEFERNVALVVCLFHDLGDAGVVKVEGVPAASAVVGFGLKEDGFGGQLLETRIGIFEKIAGVEGDLKPRGVYRFNNFENAFGADAETPMVFETEDDAAFFGVRDELFHGGDDPFESLFFGVAFEDLFDSTVGHEVIEVLSGSPATGIDAKSGNAEGVGLLDIGDGLLDVSTSDPFDGVDEVLMGREAHEVDSGKERASFDLLESGRGEVFELDLKDFDTIEAAGGGEIDAFADVAVFIPLEAPVAVGGYADRVSSCLATEGKSGS